MLLQETMCDVIVTHVKVISSLGYALIRPFSELVRETIRGTGNPEAAYLW